MRIHLTVLSAAILCGFTQPPPRDAPAIVACYYANAVVAGQMKCDPPALLVESIFGACAGEEDIIRQRVMESGPNPVDAIEEARIAIATVHQRMSPRIQGWILDSQVGPKSACSRP